MTRNTTARPLQLIWGDDIEGLVGPGEKFSFEIPGDWKSFTLELSSPVSPDGAILVPGMDAQLYASDGVWTFGNDLGDGNAEARLNGQRPNAYIWSGSLMRVDHGGLLHLQNSDEWWVWTPRRFVRTEAP
jgi:hypothetical protein